MYILCPRTSTLPTIRPYSPQSVTSSGNKTQTWAVASHAHRARIPPTQAAPPTPLLARSTPLLSLSQKPPSHSPNLSCSHGNCHNFSLDRKDGHAVTVIVLLINISINLSAVTNGPLAIGHGLKVNLLVNDKTSSIPASLEDPKYGRQSTPPCRFFGTLSARMPKMMALMVWPLPR